MNEPNAAEVNQAPEGREPIFLLPNAVTALIGFMVAVHLASTLVLNDTGLAQLYYWFAFFALRIQGAFQDISIAVPLIWTPFSHAFLHANWEHLFFNCAWLAIFGTPVARRYGAGALLAIFLASAWVGAAAFAVTTYNDFAFLIGASGGVAGLTGAAVRFMFQPVLWTKHPETGEPIVLGRKLMSLGELLRDRRAGGFTLIWLGINAAVPLFPIFFGMDVGIAWQAHLGGFFAGLLMVGLFERRA
jgi:membrane associated rhomboid family serine protease